MYITLATRRDTVDFINEKKLSELPGESTILTGEIHGEFPESSLPTQMELEVKPGAQIIFIKNDYDHRWVNGTIGTISGIDEEDTLYVITEDGQEFDVKKVYGVSPGSKCDIHITFIFFYVSVVTGVQ